MLQKIASQVDAIVDQVPKAEGIQVPEVPEVAIPETPAMPSSSVTAPETPGESQSSISDRLKHAGKAVAKALFVIPCKAIPLIMNGKFGELSGVWKEEKEALDEAYEEVTHLT